MGSKRGFLCSYTALSAVLIVAVLGSQWKFVNAQIECGTIDSFLSQHDPRAQSPWTATLYFQSTKCDFRPAGNGHGVILGPTAVLIKGNFMWSTDGFGGIRMDSYSPNHFMVVVGLKSKSPFVADQHTQFLKVSHIQPHSLSYDTYTEYDYAIVHLKNPIQYTSFVRPICVDVLPEGVFDRSNSSLFNEHLMITGFRTGSGNFKSALHPGKDNFGLLSSEFCTSKLQKDLTRSNASPLLLKADSPCGVSTNAMEGALDVRSIVSNGGNAYSNSIKHLNQLLNFTYLETVKGYRPLPNICFHNGAAVVTLYKGKWHLAGIVTESLGLSCESNLYFVSFVASRNSLNWVLQHLRNGLTSFVCATGQTINLESSCDGGNEDCQDLSDEDSKMCECSPSCSSSSSCILQPMCKHCPPSDSLRVLKNTYKFSTAVTPLKRHCAPVFPPLGTTVYCKASGVKSRIPCDHKHFPGTQAIFSCQHFDIQTPSTYCVITCKEDGDWTDELNSFQCNHMNNKINEEPVLITDRRNLSASSSASVAFTSTTTQLPITPRPISPIVEEGERNTAISFGDKYRDKNGTSMCPPIKVRDGVEVSCWTTSSSKQVPCEKPMYPGAKAEFRCNRYYRPLLSTASVIKQCQPDGEWSLSNRNFDCRLDCGIPKSDFIGHIVNGRETDGAKWPWHGLIFIDIGNHNYTYICGSTLVSKRILVTAAHCVTDRQGNAKSPSLFKAVLAATSNIYHKNILDDDIQIFDVSKIVVHSLFNVANFEADIAILQLSRQIEVSDYVRPSCYPSTLGGHTELKHLSPGSVGTVVGFGYDETGKPSKTLREAGLPVVSYKDCFEISRIQHSTTQYCAGYTNGTSVCNGDSGSGQFFVEEFPLKRMYLQGIVSHGNRDESSRLCDHNQYSVFTKVGSYKNWISETGYELDEEF